MTRTTRSRIAWAGWLVLALLPLAGCRCCYPVPNQPIPSTCKACTLADDEPTPPWAMLPQQSKNHVYIYLLNGNDPFNSGNLYGARDYLQARGFIKTSYGQQYHGPWFEAEILDLAERDPNAHFILAGFSAAAGPVNQLARRLGDAGVRIDRLIYLDGVFLWNPEEMERPETVAKFVAVRSEGWVVQGVEHPGAENILVAGAGHFDIPTHPKTLQALLNEATEVAATVPSLVEVPPPLRPGPRPTPLVHRTVHRVAPDWEFLQQNVVGVPLRATSEKPLVPVPEKQSPLP